MALIYLSRKLTKIHFYTVPKYYNLGFFVQSLEACKSYIYIPNFPSLFLTNLFLSILGQVQETVRHHTYGNIKVRLGLFTSMVMVFLYFYAIHVSGLPFKLRAPFYIHSRHNTVSIKKNKSITLKRDKM